MKRDFDDTQEPSTQPQEVNAGSPSTAETNSKRRIAMLALAGIFIIIGLLWVIYWFIWGRYEEYTDDAYVNGNMVQLMPQVAGTVVEIKTDDAQLVKENQVIIKLDPSDYQVALEQAKAHLALVVRQVRQYYENAKEAQQNLNLDHANLVKAELDLKRRLNLVGNHAVSKEEIQHYQTSFAAAQAHYKVALHRLESAKALVENSHLYNHPLVDDAKSKLKNAFLNYQRTTIVAPISGYIAKRNVQLGQQVTLNSVMLAIIPLHGTWVDANFKESSLNLIRSDQPVTLYADAYPDVTYHGRVVGLNAGTGSAFSLLPPQNATGNWIKIVQRLPVRIQLDEKELKENPLQLGLSMRVTVDTHERGGHRMPLKANQQFHFTTSAYAKQLAQVDALINDILHSNSPDVSFAKITSNE